MYIMPNLQDCLDENGRFSEAKFLKQCQYLLGLRSRPPEYQPVGRAVIVMESGQVREVVTDQIRPIDIAVLDCGYHVDGEPERPGGETVRLAVCDGAAQRVDRSFVERTFAAGAKNPVHIRLSRFGVDTDDPLGVETSPAYGEVLDAICLDEIDERRLDEPAAVVVLARSLRHLAPGENIVAFHFRGEALAGCTIEEAGLTDAALLQAPNLFRATLQSGGDSVVLVFRPDRGGVPDIPPGLVGQVGELKRVGETIGVRVRDLILSGSHASSRTEFISLLNPGAQTATPFDGDQQ